MNTASRNNNGQYHIYLSYKEKLKALLLLYQIQFWQEQNQIDKLFSFFETQLPKFAIFFGAIFI
ncbi:MAG: hypothetical protein EBR82_58325 [Caulobacteraceae bacterium]|nr:hypothetical protein [Caulobacteraceae bacterium]